MKRSIKTALIVGGSIAALGGAAVLIGVVIWAVTLFSGATNEYSAKVQTLDSAQKSFDAGETAEIGPYDVTVTALQKKYAPSKEEAESIQDVLTRFKRLSDSKTDVDHSGYSLTDKTGQYVRVTLIVKSNPARSDYDDISTSTGSWVSQLGELELNDMVPLAMNPDPELYKTEKEMIAATKTAEGLTMTLVYRVPLSTTEFALKYDISIFTKVSAIVGTEGMPRKTYEYTISIQ